ncbi:MAG: HAD-IC family P-type ATPase [Micrococcales bacterium]|nr:HAD-IC family P-type ATPase [Micrococcales bacterium]
MTIVGLTSTEVAAQVAAGQVNTSSARSSRSVGDILRGNIFTLFNGLLLSLATIVIVIDRSPFNALFGIVMVVNSGIGIFQEMKAKRLLDRLAILHAPRARVLRDGETREIAVEEVVLGDALLLELGDQVVADGEVVDSSELEIDESLLTGESDPVVKKQGDTVLSGSIVVAGAGAAQVTAVGEASYAAKVATHAKRFQRAHSELLASTNTVLKWISWMLAIVGPVLVWGQLRLDTGQWRVAVIHATAAIVGMIPEGLVLLTSMAFMLATMTLARREVLVQQMPAVEGLARVDTLLLDKTGTLTEGVIQFEDLVGVEGEERDVIVRCLATMARRSKNPTNQAIIEALGEAAPFEVIGEVPFSSARKWSAVTTPQATWLLGAPEMLFAGRTQEPMFAQARGIAQEGKRVLVVMSAAQAPQEGVLPKERQARALVVLSESVRPDARQTLGYFAEQGVDIKVISGDSPLTVAAVARRVGLDVDQAFDARELPEDPMALAGVLAQYNVFGRVQPEQKRLIARCLQGQGRVVAMTGDGVNDAMALKDADIGIAMNSGATATKAVAELILLDNQFARLPKVLAEGRRVIANIERVANLFLIKNVYSLTLALAVTVASLTYPYLPSQMTVISALTIGVPAFFLALGPNTRIYRPGFLRRVLRFAIPVGFICAVAMMVVYAQARRAGLEVGQAGTSTSIALVMIGMWVLVCLARPLRGWKLGLIAACAGAYVAVLFIPVLSTRFGYNVHLLTLPAALIAGAAGALAVELIWSRTRALT